MSPKTFEAACVALVRRAFHRGLEQALADEMERPTLDDEEWSRFIVATATNQDCETAGDDGECSGCGGTGLEVYETEQRPGILWSRLCDCPRGLIRREKERAAQQAQRERRERIAARRQRELRSVANPPEEESAVERFRQRTKMFGYDD